MIIQEIIIILFLILLNGFLASSEIALISSSKTRLDAFIRKGSRNAALVQKLKNTPDEYLSAVQVGITMIGIIMGVYSGTTVAGELTLLFEGFGFSPAVIYSISIASVVIIITYLSLVIGELVPKRIALINPESVSLFVVRPMILISWIAMPFIKILSISTRFVLRILNVKDRKQKVTEEEIRALVREGRMSGAIERIEQDIVERVFTLGDLKAGSLMTYRKDLVWLDVSDSQEQIKKKISGNIHSVYPLCDGDLQNYVGYVHSKDLFNALLSEPVLDLKKCVRKLNLFSMNTEAYEMMSRFSETHSYCGLVLSDTGLVQGIVTIHNILDVLVGSTSETDDIPVVRREDGSMLLDGKLPLYELIPLLGLKKLDIKKTDYYTLRGFMLDIAGKVPNTGDRYEYDDYIFEIVDMDGKKIDKVIVFRKSE